MGLAICHLSHKIAIFSKNIGFTSVSERNQLLKLFFNGMENILTL